MPRPYLCGVKMLRFAPLLLLLTSCLSLQSDEQKAEAAEKAVLARHDELMAQMDQLYDLRQQLQKTPPADTAATSRQRQALLAADAGMMDWMHQYRRPADTATVARRLTYYAAQQQRIDSVGRLFRSSLDSARLLLKSAAANSSTR
ncbi:hypothetical protein SAMN06265337_0500 [Hymenobacter gelipurpurascens]|uniref:Uncharacterized protein n=1 Tax=Hymenobacter gelipurpurascens TaxID=89968 RepID=A0A212T6Y5_9BACT|nr:hypothetical protein [Hymenobacter gelipurpurascens]SNC61596.1 hypothetical protein SAMN06265337_0500 [Hymenobacter gelipurpurascens]